MKIIIGIPAFNEEKNIAGIITKLADITDTIIVCNDGSSDLTSDIAEKMGAFVINHEKNLGYGAAIRSIFLKAKELDGDILVTFDADGQHRIEDIEKVTKPIIDQEADLVIGSRFLKPNLVLYKYRWINRLGVRILSKILSSFVGFKITDSHGGIRAMRASVVRELEMIGTHTYVQETIIDASDKGFRIKEIPSVWKKRREGKSRVVSSIPTYIFYTLPILIIRSKQHIKWLYSLGIALILLALLYFLLFMGFYIFL